MGVATTHPVFGHDGNKVSGLRRARGGKGRRRARRGGRMGVGGGAQARCVRRNSSAKTLARKLAIAAQIGRPSSQRRPRNRLFKRVFEGPNQRAWERTGTIIPPHKRLMPLPTDIEYTRRMRFIGNKEIIAPAIRALLEEVGLTDQRLIFFDAFCGTGTVADSVKDCFDIKLNDILEWCSLYAKGRIVASSCKFKSLGFDPFDHLDSDKGFLEGFFYKNYSPGGSSRMYFTAANAGRIDHIRAKIEDWREKDLIDENEYAYLLASLIESISSVSNTAGVYGAFLKHWDPRSNRPLAFNRVDARSTAHSTIETYNGKIEDIVTDVDCDILYLDPPYTQNQYGTQYHLLETLIKCDNPTLSAVTGSRPTGPMRSDWSKDVKTHILFDHIVANTRANHIIVSYSADGFMSRNYIESVLRRYGKPETLISRQIDYRNYANFKSRGRGDHVEYLFYVEKRPLAEVTYMSPLNYIGGKTRMLPFLKSHFPASFGKFVDAFGGGFNVGINSQAETVVYNDYNHLVASLIRSFSDNDTYEFVKYVRRHIIRFGLEKENEATYLLAREHYNLLPPGKRDPRLLYTIIMYGFNQQIRFNSDHDFNNPVGQRWFNERILERLVSFSRAIKSKNVEFLSRNYLELIDEIDTDTFVYLDPPYRLTTGAYNDGKRGFGGWDHSTESQLFKFIEGLNSRSVKFMLSYVAAHRGRENFEFVDWVAGNGFRMIECEQTQGVGRREVIVVNYAQ